MLKANFKITETGGTGHVQLQSSDDSGITWQDVGSMLTLSQGALTVDDSANINIDTSVFISGDTYSFRLTDIAGTPVSHIVTFTIPAVSITGYSAGQATIGFVNTGGDNWDVTFTANPSVIQTATTGVTADSIDYRVAFISGGSAVSNTSDNSISDQTLHVSNGAGIYILNAQYNLSDGSYFSVSRTVKVDGTGNILGDIQRSGLTINSVSGVNIDVTAHVSQTGYSGSIVIASVNDSGPATLATATTYSGAMPADTTQIAVYVVMDRAFWSDLPSGLPDFGLSSVSSVTIP